MKYFSLIFALLLTVNLYSHDFAYPTHYCKGVQNYEKSEKKVIEPKININAATKSELVQLDGIGPAKAWAIIDARPYQSVDDLTKAKGIGNATLSKIEEYITTEGESKLQTDDESSEKININTASASELRGLHGIGHVLSKRIINARPFNDIHEIKDVKGIEPKTFRDIRRNITTE